MSSINQIGEAMRKRFDEEGKPGYNSGIVFDLWWNGSMRGAPDFHNMLGFLTETALYRYATPHCYDAEGDSRHVRRARRQPAGEDADARTTPIRGWAAAGRCGDAWTTCSTASRATLDFAPKLQEDHLFNIWRMGTRQIARGEKAAGRAVCLRHRSRGAARSDRARSSSCARSASAASRSGGPTPPFSAGGRTVSGGHVRVPPQPFRPYVVDLMEPKQFPDRRLYPGGPPDPPYDMTGYELSLQMGVTADRVKEAFTLPARDRRRPCRRRPAAVAGAATAAFLRCRRCQCQA